MYMCTFKNTVYRVSNKGLNEVMLKVKIRCNHHGFKYLALRIDEHEPEVQAMSRPHLFQPSLEQNTHDG